VIGFAYMLVAARVVAVLLLMLLVGGIFRHAAEADERDSADYHQLVADLRRVHLESAAMKLNAADDQ
jgi:hypothetical protein